MLRNVLTQSLYQLAVTLFLVYDGAFEFGITDEYLVNNGYSVSVSRYLNTFIFNTFVLCQVC